MTIEFLDDEEKTEESEDIIEYRINKARKKCDNLNKEDFKTIRVYAPDIDTLNNILRALKREFGKRNINKRCAEYILTELGYRTLYRYLASTKFSKFQKLTNRIDREISNKLFDNCPKLELNLGRNNGHLFVHVSEQQQEQVHEVALDFGIPNGEVELFCLILAFNDLEKKFDVGMSSSVKYQKFFNKDGHASTIVSSIYGAVKSMNRYVINSLPVLQLSIKEKEILIASGYKVSPEYTEIFQRERKLRDDIEEFLEKLKTG